MTTDLPTLRQRLADAENAMHQLMIGKAVVSLTHTIAGSQSVAFTRANVPQLEAYIGRLKTEIARVEGRRGRRAFYIT